ncbi:MAG: N5-glutamine methyltransferase family protein [[Clostridium] symbiosum]
MAKKNVRRHFLVQKGTARSESTLISDTPWKLKMCTYVYQGGDAQEQETAGESVSDNGYSPGIARIPGVRKKEFVLLESDLFLNLEQDEKFDIIVSNPPYIPSAVIDGLEPEVKDHEPRMALDGAEDGLYFYRILAQQSGRYLKEGGFIYFEIGCDQAEAVGKLLTAAGFGEIETIKDEPGLDRVVRARRNR